MPVRNSMRLLAHGVPVLAALVSFAALFGCSKPAPPRSPRVPVTVARAEKRPMPISVPATGMVEAIQTADVGSQVGGVITKIDFHEGQEVRAGQPLFELDARPFRAALGQANGQLARDRAQAYAARLAADRAATLFQGNLISQQDWDTARATADGLTATVQSDSAAANTAKLNLEYATIRSPINGSAGAYKVHVGDYMKAATSDPLVTVNQLRPINVRFTVSESDRPAVEHYRHGDPRVIVKPSNGDSVSVTGRLAFVDNAVDPTSGTLTLKGEFPNTDGKLWPGEFVEVSLVLTVQKDAIVVPAPAVTTGQQGTFVYVLNPDSTATIRPVVVARSDDAIAVIAKGVQPGETVVTDGQSRILPGSHLVVRVPGGHRKP